MSNRFTHRSFTHLAGVRPELVVVAYHALLLSPIPFQITDGLRTEEEQAILLAAGKSRTMRSRHLTGHAIDVVALQNGIVSWDWSLYETIANYFNKASKETGIKVAWGGNWKGFRDGPHFELDRELFPAGAK